MLYNIILRFQMRYFLQGSQYSVWCTVKLSTNVNIKVFVSLWLYRAIILLTVYISEATVAWQDYPITPAVSDKLQSFQHGWIRENSSLIFCICKLDTKHKSAGLKYIHTYKFPHPWAWSSCWRTGELEDSELENSGKLCLYSFVYGQGMMSGYLNSPAQSTCISESIFQKHLYLWNNAPICLFKKYMRMLSIH